VLHDQGYCCKICGLFLLEPFASNHVEHSHENGKVRGITHRECNLDIGLIERTERVRTRLAMLMNYLEIAEGGTLKGPLGPGSGGP
jgi:Recombination endonuclease VII